MNALIFSATANDLCRCAICVPPSLPPSLRFPSALLVHKHEHPFSTFNLRGKQHLIRVRIFNQFVGGLSPLVPQRGRALEVQRPAICDDPGPTSVLLPSSSLTGAGAETVLRRALSVETRKSARLGGMSRNAGIRTLHFTSAHPVENIESAGPASRVHVVDNCDSISLFPTSKEYPSSSAEPAASSFDLQF